MTEIDFRSVGYTEEAKQFPMNDIDLVARAAWNGVAVSQLPEAMRYYPNRHMQDTWRRVIDAVRDADGRATGRVNKIDPTTMAKMPPSERMVDLMGRYWKAAYQQGKEGRHHDDKQASAQIAESNLCAYVDDLRAQLLRMADIAEQRLFEIERLNMALEPFAEAPITAACDAKASEAVEAIFADMRDRRFLKWLFDIDGDANLIGRFDDGEELRGIDLEAQAEIKSAWRSIIAEALAATNAPAPQMMGYDPEPVEHQEVLDAMEACNSGESE